MQSYQSGGCFHPERTANELAIKWRQIKALMRRDIQKLRDATQGQKIVTKHEWMMGALELLEKHDKARGSASSEEAPFEEETPQMLYEALFIDPSKLTPYQHA